MLKYLTVDEVADTIRVHRTTVQRMANAGRFPGAIVVGCGKRRSWRIPEGSLQDIQEPVKDAPVKPLKDINIERAILRMEKAVASLR